MTEPLFTVVVPTFERLGICVEMDGDALRVPPDQTLRVEADEGDAIPKIDDGPWPAFPADLTSIATAFAALDVGTGARGIGVLLAACVSVASGSNATRATPRGTAASPRSSTCR